MPQQKNERDQKSEDRKATDKADNNTRSPKDGQRVGGDAARTKAEGEDQGKDKSGQSTKKADTNR